MADHGDGNMLEIERQRAARIAENNKHLMKLFGDTDMSFMAPAPRATPKPVKRIKREPGTTPAEGYRKSDRIQKLPAKPIYVVDDWTERAPKLRKPGRTGRGSTSGTCRAERGWHPGLGMASEAAGEAATDAAIERREELLADKRIAYVKLMSFSQVAGGFWEQLPRGMHSHYGHVTKLHITLHCDDQRHAGSYRNCEEGSSTKWSVVYLPRENHTAGLSGGWVGFAIDQKLFPNDTVVFEFMDKVNMRAHLYRAHDYETPETARGALQPQVIMSVAAGPSNPSAAPAATTQTTAGAAAAAAAGGAAKDAEAGASGSGAVTEGAENAAKPGSRKAAAAGAAAVGGGVAKRRRAAQAKASAGAGLVLGDVTNSDALPGGQLMQQQEGQEADEQQQQQQQQQEMEVEEHIAGVSEGEQDDVSGRDQGPKAPKNQPCKTAGQKRPQPEAAADGPGAAAAVAGAAAVPPARKRAKAAAAGGTGAAVSAAAAAAQGGAVASGAKKGSKASTGGKGGKRRAGKGAGGDAGQGKGGAGELAGPDEFDEEEARCAARGEKKRWYKTAAEQRKEQSEPQFWVRKILGTRLQAGTRQFKVRWWGFSPAWDSWEPVECLDKPPATYPWAVPIPPEVRSM